mgnify:CR=1 FL=1
MLSMFMSSVPSLVSLPDLHAAVDHADGIVIFGVLLQRILDGVDHQPVVREDHDLLALLGVIPDPLDGAVQLGVGGEILCKVW